MSFEIKPGQRIKEVKDLFEEAFPHLKLIIYAAGKTMSRENELSEDLSLSAVNNHGGAVKVTESLTAEEFETAMKNNFGVNAQVFRQSGKLWLQTSSTDHWTLKEQNHEGQESTKKIKEKPEDRDYHEQE